MSTVDAPRHTSSSLLQVFIYPLFIHSLFSEHCQLYQVEMSLVEYFSSDNAFHLGNSTVHEY